MKKLYLAGGGVAEQSRHIDARFVAEIPHSKRLLYWSMALRGKRPPDDCLGWIQSTLGRYGIDDIVMWDDFTGHTESDLRNFDAVYIGGGNTYQLLGELRSSGFDSYLANFANSGCPVYGGSAGAAILGCNIETVAHIDTNAVGLEHFAALDLAGGAAIWVHYDPADDPAIVECAERLGCPILAIAENGGVVLVDGKIETAYGRVCHFDQSGKRELASHTTK